MGVGSSFQHLTEVVQQLEGDGYAVSTATSQVEDGQLRSDLSVDLPLLPETETDGVAVSIRDIEIEDGVAKLDVSVTVSLDRESASDASRPCETGRSNGHGTRESGASDAIPTYKDPDRLRAVYDRYDTFPDMTEALGVGVTPKTVRNHMVKHGIHNPEINKITPESASLSSTDESDTASDESVAVEEESTESDRSESRARESEQSEADTASDPSQPESPESEQQHTADEDTATNGATSGTGDTDSETGDERIEMNERSPEAVQPINEEVISDGLGLPEHLTLQDVKASVQRATTLHGVHRDLDNEREEVVDILESLNLLDLVYSRLSSSVDEVTVEEIDSRIRRASLIEST